MDVRAGGGRLCATAASQVAAAALPAVLAPPRCPAALQRLPHCVVLRHGLLACRLAGRAQAGVQGAGRCAGGSQGGAAGCVGGKGAVAFVYMLCSELVSLCS